MRPLTKTHGQRLSGHFGAWFLLVIVALASACSETIPAGKTPPTDGSGDSADSEAGLSDSAATTDVLVDTGSSDANATDAEPGPDQVDSAADVTAICPTTVLTYAGPTVVEAPWIIKANAKTSTSPAGSLVAWYWQFTAPDGTTRPLWSQKTPDDIVAIATLVGTWTLCLTVTDSAGNQSCQPACQQFEVQTKAAVHVELVWDTPTDPDPFDEGPAAGADLDLHLAHPLASGPDLDGDGVGDPWFNSPFDTFWFNANPSWFVSPAGKALPQHDPYLDMDDADGAGPELLDFTPPPDQSHTFALGVHSWNDHGYGASTATLRIYVNGVLTWQPKRVLQPRDMWRPGTLVWTAGQNNQPPTVAFVPCAGVTCLTPCYSNPAFDQQMGAGMPPCKKP